MALRNIFTMEDPALRKKCKEVKEVNDHVIEIIEDLKETMMDAVGVGLAAPQVGILRRIAVVSIDGGENFYELINPVILKEEGDQYGEEGCLSVPGKAGFVHRPFKIKVESLNRSGEKVIYEVEDFAARAFCHEIDHLDGIVYVDKAENIHDLDDEDEYQSAEDK